MKIWIRAANQIYLCDFVTIRHPEYSHGGDRVDVVIGVPGQEEVIRLATMTTTNGQKTIDAIWDCIKRGEPFEIPREWIIC